MSSDRIIKDVEASYEVFLYSSTHSSNPQTWLFSPDLIKDHRLCLSHIYVLKRHTAWASIQIIAFKQISNWTIIHGRAAELSNQDSLPRDPVIGSILNTHLYAASTVYVRAFLP